MSNTRWDPLHNVSALQNRINQLFDNAFPVTRDSEDDLTVCDWRPLVDIYETDESLVLIAELPGVEKEHVNVEIKDNILTLSGERKPDLAVDDDRYLRRERCTGIFSRSFNLRHHTRPDAIRAKFKNGLLEVTIPKPEEDRPRQVTVNVE